MFFTKFGQIVCRHLATLASNQNFQQKLASKPAAILAASKNKSNFQRKMNTVNNGNKKAQNQKTHQNKQKNSPGKRKMISVPLQISQQNSLVILVRFN